MFWRKPRDIEFGSPRHTKGSDEWLLKEEEALEKERRKALKNFYRGLGWARWSTGAFGTVFFVLGLCLFWFHTPENLETLTADDMPPFTLIFYGLVLTGLSALLAITIHNGGPDD
jgi:hypothetical protein